MTCGVCSSRHHCDRRPRRHCKCQCGPKQQAICTLAYGLLVTLGIAIYALIKSFNCCDTVQQVKDELCKFEQYVACEIAALQPPVGTMLSIEPTEEPIGGYYYPFDGTMSEVLWYRLDDGAADCTFTSRICSNGEPSNGGGLEGAAGLTATQVQLADGEFCGLRLLYEALGEPPVVVGEDGFSYFRITDGTGPGPTNMIIVGECIAKFAYCATYDPVTGLTTFTPQERPTNGSACTPL